MASGFWAAAVEQNNIMLPSERAAKNLFIMEPPEIGNSVWQKKNKENENSPILGRREGKVKKMRNEEFGMRNNRVPLCYRAVISEEKTGTSQF
jgi:hypothetical protein